MMQSGATATSINSRMARLLRSVLRRHVRNVLPAVSVSIPATSASAPTSAVAATARCFSATHSSATAGNYRAGMEKEIEALPETKARNDLSSFLKSSTSSGLAYDTGLSTANPFHHDVPTPPTDGYRHLMSPDQIRTTLDAAMATFHLHVESERPGLLHHCSVQRGAADRYRQRLGSRFRCRRSALLSSRRFANSAAPSGQDNNGGHTARSGSGILRL